MKINKQLRAVVVSELAHMSPGEFYKTLQAAFDSRRKKGMPAEAPIKKRPYKRREKLPAKKATTK